MGALRELHLFAGAGGGILGGLLLGHTPACAVEIDPYCRRVLLQRQRDGVLPRFPIWDDIRTFDGGPWRGRVDVVAGGFPCQDISAAGKGEGIEGTRSGLWKQMDRVIGEIRPRYVFVENSPLLVGRGLATVLSDLAQRGYDARWCIMGADDVGAPHFRKRIWILAHSKGIDPWRLSFGKTAAKSRFSVLREDGAYSDCYRCHKVECQDGSAAQGARLQCATLQHARHAFGLRREKRWEQNYRCHVWEESSPRDWWQSEPDVGRVAYGVADRVDRIKAIGNGQVPGVAAVAWRILTSAL